MTMTERIDGILQKIVTLPVNNADTYAQVQSLHRQLIGVQRVAAALEKCVPSAVSSTATKSQEGETYAV